MPDRTTSYRTVPVPRPVRRRGLRIRAKLVLLLAIPLAAVLLVMVPYTFDRVGDARSAGVTARSADAARAVGTLIQSLQQERLLALGYLSTPALDRSSLVAQAQQAADEAATLRSDPSTSAILAAAGDALDRLAALRSRIVDRTVAASDAYRVFAGATTALLDALNLARAPGADATGLRQLAALDALMRSSEEASSVGAILVAAAANTILGPDLITDAVTADQVDRQRFEALAEPAQVDLVRAVESGEAAAHLRSLTASVVAGQPMAVADALTAAVTYTGLRRLAQDRIAREIATDAGKRAGAATGVAWAVTAGGIALFVVVVVLGAALSRSIARPLRRLTRAAGVVAELSRAELMRVADSDALEPAPPRLGAITVDRADEIGELALALNRVQATAALLLERQVSTRRNIAVMFANVARRTQTLVGRQVRLLDDLEREQAAPALASRLQNLDNLAARLRRSADSLLVVSGTIDQQLQGTPTALADLVRDTLAETGSPNVEIGEIAEIAVNAVVATDLRLLLAELLENATNFSPPSSPITITATLVGEGCEIRVVDRGVGMSESRRAEENQRLVERERLDIAPTSVLGLFVVGRLARRHGLHVRLEANADRGTTAAVLLPARLFAPGPAPAAIERTARRRSIRRAPPRTVAIPEPYGSFPWFTIDAPPAANAPAVARLNGAGASLPQRSPGASLAPQLAETDPALGPRDPQTPRRRDPDAERDQLNQYVSGLARGEDAGATQSTLAERPS